MFETHLIQRLIVSSVHPFGHDAFDFLDPESGETLRNICLHGPNGCGKSTLLRCLRGVLDPALPLLQDGPAAAGGLVLAKLSSGEESRWLVRGPRGAGEEEPSYHWFREDLEEAEGWERLAEEEWDLARFAEAFAEWRLPEDAAAYSLPAEGEILGPGDDWASEGDLPETAGLQKILARSRRDREQAFLSYLAHPQSQERSVAEVRERFDELSPDPVEAVRRFWEESMADCGLALITEPMLGFQRSGTDGPVPVESVSPSLRRYLRSAVVGRLGSTTEGEDGCRFLFVDSLEAGLGGDLPAQLASFLLDSGRQRGIQAFFATLSPAVVGLFSEDEVVRLGFEEGRTGRVRAMTSDRRSKRCGADDADSGCGEGVQDEDSLKSDREVEIAPGFASLGALKRAIQETEDQEELADLIDRLVSMRGR